MSENRAEQDVDPVRESRNRGMEGKKGQKMGEIEEQPEKKPRDSTRRSKPV
jgi:hypothetical protein